MQTVDQERFASTNLQTANGQPGGEAFADRPQPKKRRVVARELVVVSRNKRGNILAHRLACKRRRGPQTGLAYPLTRKVKEDEYAAT